MKEFCLHVGRLLIHNKEQYDLGMRPLLCIHMEYNRGSACRRVFYIGRPRGKGVRIWIGRLPRSSFAE